MSWRNDLVVRSGVVGFGFGFVAPCPGLDCFGGVGRSRSRGKDRRRGAFRSVPFQIDEERGGAGRGAKAPNPRDVTGVGARGRVPWRAVCRQRLPDITTRAPRLGFFFPHFFYSATPSPTRLLRLRIAMRR
jgi:hypothetical protein